MALFIISLFVLLALIGYLVKIYNQLIRRRNDLHNAFGQIDVQLARRYDLIPNLIEVAKKYMQHEQETLTAVIAARNQANQAREQARQSQDKNAMQSLMQAENLLTRSLQGLALTVENYPDLKADQQMRELQEEIASTENRIAFARQHYNDSVTEFNNTAEQFPNNIISRIFNFEAQQWLNIENIQSKRENIKVSF